MSGKDIILEDSIALAEAKVISIDLNAAQAPDINDNAFDTSGNAEFGGFDKNQVEFLKSLGFTKGLIQALAANYKAFKKRVWLVDNSGSMKMMDGQKIEFSDGFCKCLPNSEPNTSGRIAQCSRWDELSLCVDYHTEMAAQLQIPTLFRVNEQQIYALKCCDYFPSLLTD